MKFMKSIFAVASVALALGLTMWPAGSKAQAHAGIGFYVPGFSFGIGTDHHSHSHYAPYYGYDDYHPYYESRRSYPYNGYNRTYPHTRRSVADPDFRYENH